MKFEFVLNIKNTFILDIFQCYLRPFASVYSLMVIRF